jgi:hypothetical protein
MIEFLSRGFPQYILMNSGRVYSNRPRPSHCKFLLKVYSHYCTPNLVTTTQISEPAIVFFASGGFGEDQGRKHKLRSDGNERALGFHEIIQSLSKKGKAVLVL